MTEADYAELAAEYFNYQQNIQTRNIFIVLAYILICSMLIRLLKKQYDQKLSKESNRKLKLICKMERRPILEQVALIIDMFIDAYTEKHKINWDEYLY